MCTRRSQFNLAHAHAHVQRARTRTEHGCLGMESWRVIFSARYSGLSPPATRNVGHLLFSGDETIKPVQPAQPCPKARPSPAHQTLTVPAATAARARPPDANLPSAPPMGRSRRSPGLGLFKEECACIRGPL